ncbi:MAG: hypothetical protein ACYTFG_20005 [Planctomycetota bacterium]|jgi:hypothetical protein
MDIYNYDENGHYTKTTEARLDPLEGTPMIPARATATAVPTAAIESYQRYKYDGTSWIVDDIQPIIDSMLAETNVKGSNLYEDDGNGKPVARLQADIDIDDAEADKVVLRNTAYSNMQNDVYTELENTFGTRKSETATAMAMTWDLMKATPSDYSALGLEAEFDLTGIVKGDALDTDAKVLDYATQLVAKKLTYSQYRMQRIKTYNDEIVTIG